MKYLAVLLSLALKVSAIAQDVGEPWYQRHLVGMEVGPTGAQFGYSDPRDTRYAAHFDGAMIVQRAAAAQSEYLVLWARDGDFAYYNSKILPKAPGLGSRDPLREAIEEASKHKLPLLAYCVVQQGGHFLKAHPEFEMKSAEGKPIGRFCLNSGYLEAMKQIVAEQLAYGIAGLHIDMLDQGFGQPYGCWCETCQRAFEKRYGHPMPKAATWDASWDEMLEFRHASSDSFEKELAAYIKSINPKATADFNYHGNPPFSFEVGQRPVQHASNGDFVTGETGAWAFSALTVGLNAEFYRAATPGKRVQVAMQRGVRMYHDQTTRPLADIRWELFTLLAHGAFVTMVDKTAFDGSLDSVAYERIGKAFSEARSQQAHLGKKPVREVGIYFSSRSRDWMGREQPMTWMRSFLGAHEALVCEHIPFGIVLDENATIDLLQSYPVILLPNAGILSESELALFRSYVESGGKLVVTGRSGQLDRLGKPLENFRMGELIGAKLAGHLDSMDNWVRFAKAHESNGVIAENLTRDWPFLVEGPATIYEATGARAIGELLKPSRTTQQLAGKEATEWPMSADVPVGPAILLNQVGKGSVLTFAASPDYATASEHQTVEARQLLTNAIRFLYPNPRVAIRAPANVESVITDDPESHLLRIHFIAYNPTPRTIPVKERPYVIPGLIEDAPIFRATIKTTDVVQKVSALNPSTQITQRGNQIDVLISDIHETLLLEY